MLKLHHQPKLERKLSLIIELGIKWKFIKICRKYKIEKELQKFEFKNEFKDAKLGGSPLFINTLSKSWPLD